MQPHLKFYTYFRRMLCWGLFSSIITFKPVAQRLQELGQLLLQEPSWAICLKRNYRRAIPRCKPGLMKTSIPAKLQESWGEGRRPVKKRFYSLKDSTGCLWSGFGDGFFGLFGVGFLKFFFPSNLYDTSMFLYSGFL